tara:strand:- start:43 stop:243 length:201 start_codon:yes stop_codon:yes gene_type:complete
VINEENKIFKIPTIKSSLKKKYFLLIKYINNIRALNQEETVVAIGIIINPKSLKKYKLIKILIATE